MRIIIDAEEYINVPAVGRNNADNTFNSPSVVANRDGSTLERLEFLMDLIGTNATNLTDLIASLLVLTETGGTITTDGTEQNVYINNAPAGIYDPKIVQIDFTNQTAAETVIVREYYRIKTGGNFIQEDEESFVGVRTLNLKTIELAPNRFGVKITMEKTAGANKDYDYEAVYKI